MIPKLRPWWLAVVGIVLPAAALAQQPTTIHGRVVDQTGTGLPAVSVYIKAMNLGTLTDGDGRYSLLVPASRATGQAVALTATRIGFKSQTVSVELSGGTVTQDFALATDVLQLQAVVATGQGTQTTRERLASSVATVKSTDIVRSNESNVVEALAGKAPGVQVTSSGGDPGAGSYIQIRGAASISGGTQPLFVVDGTPIDNSSDRLDSSVAGTVVTNRAADINPNDIERVEILKGAAATAIYGSRAANGVVLITTKSGAPNTSRASLNTSFGVNHVTNIPALNTEYGQGSHGSFNSSCTTSCTSSSWGPLLDAGTPVYDHAGEIYQDAQIWNTNLSLSGGSERTAYYLSFGRDVQPGIIRGPQDYNKTEVRLKGSHFFLDDLQATGNLAYTASSGTFVQQGSNISGIQLGALRTPPDFNNLPYLDPATGIQRTYRDPHPARLTESHGYDNPFFVAYKEPTTSDVGRSFGNIGLNYTPATWLKVSYLLGADYSSDDRASIFPKSSDNAPQGEILRSTFIHNIFDSNLTATATGNLSSGVSGSLTVGQNLNQDIYRRNGVTGTTLITGTEETNFAVNNTGNEYKYRIRTDGYFATGQLTLGDQLTVNGTGRFDGSSTFGGSGKHFFYPGAGAAWTFTRLPFFQDNLGFLSFGKLRTSWGVAGRQPPVFSNVNAYTTGSFADGWVNNGLFSLYNGQEGVFSQGTLGNPDIKPERQTSWEAGADLAFFNQKLAASVTYYHNSTTDAILRVPVPPSTGYFSQYQNAAAWNNHGWEAQVNFQAVQKKNFSWSVGAQWSMTRSCVTDLKGAQSIGLNGFGGGEMQAALVAPDTVNGAIKCHPFGVLYSEDMVRFGRGLHDADGNSIDQLFPNAPAGAMYVATDGYPVLDPTNRVQGDPTPDWLGSIRSTITLYHKLTVSGLLDIKHGGLMWNGTRGALSYFGAAGWTVPYHGAGVTQTFGQFIGQPAAGPGVDKQVVFDQNWFQNNVGSGFTGGDALYVENAGFVKLRDISVTYTLNGGFLGRLGLTSVDLTASGRNLKTWTKYTGIDPESNLTGQSIGRGLDYFNNPQTRSFIFTVGLNR